MDDVPGQTQRQPAPPSRSLFQYIEKRKYLCRRLPAESMGRQRHEDHERVPGLVQQHGRSPDARGPRKDVSVLQESPHRYV